MEEKKEGEFLGEIRNDDIEKIYLFTSPKCPRCPAAKNFNNTYAVTENIVEVTDDADLKLAQEYKVNHVPQYVVVYKDSFINEDGKEVNYLHKSMEEILEMVDNQEIGYSRG